MANIIWFSLSGSRNLSQANCVSLFVQMKMSMNEDVYHLLVLGTTGLS